MRGRESKGGRGKIGVEKLEGKRRALTEPIPNSCINADFLLGRKNLLHYSGQSAGSSVHSPFRVF